MPVGGEWPHPFVRSLAQGLDLWWERWVPVVFPGYLAARVATARWPWPAAAAVTSALSFSAAGVLSGLDAYRRREVTAAEAERCWIWANGNNPWLTAVNPHVWISAGLATALVGLASHARPARTAQSVPRLHPAATEWGAWTAEAMNWAAVLGVVSLITAVGGLVGPPTRLWLGVLDPLSSPPSDPVWGAAALSLNGALLLVPELVLARRLGLPAGRLLLWRLLQAALAAILAAASLAL